MSTVLALDISTIAMLAMLQQQQAKTTKVDIGNDTTMITFQFAAEQRITMKINQDQNFLEANIWFRGGKQPTMTAMMAMKAADHNVGSLFRQIDDGILVMASVVAHPGVILSQAGVTLRDIRKLSPVLGGIIRVLLDSEVLADGKTDHFNLIAGQIASIDTSADSGDGYGQMGDTTDLRKKVPQAA